jgi:DUF1680 family protein
MNTIGQSRRNFVKSLAGAAALASVCGICHGVETHPSSLAAPRFQLLPLGAIRPLGWLKRQLEIQANGLTRHLDEFWPDLSPDSGWLGGNGESWERGPYYMDGLVPLAYLLQDARLLEKANRWVNWTLAHPQANGQMGPARNDDWWPRMVMLKVLTQYQEATGDSRVVPLMEHYFAYQLQELPHRPLRDWGKYRWQDEALSIAWLYRRTGQPELLALANLLRGQGHDWTAEFANFPFTHKMTTQELGFSEKDPLPDRAMQSHGVNNAMALKTAPVWSLFSNSDAGRRAIYNQLDALDRYHGLPNGMFSADEHFAGRNPSQGTELCAVVEAMFSLEQSLAILGDARLGDRLEIIAFNALPGTFTNDMWAHQYDQQPNQISCTLRKRPWTSNGPEANLFGLEPNFGCCCANMHQGWPKFAASLWMADSHDGLVAGLYAPCEVRTKVGSGVALELEESTDYPFKENIQVNLRVERPVKFPLSFRMPWCATDSSIRVNGKLAPVTTSKGFATLDRAWKTGDRIEIKFPMRPRLTAWSETSVSVQRGPLVFSLPLEENWQKLRDRGMTADWQVTSNSPWNYALDAASVEVATPLETQTAPEGSPFSSQHIPIRIKVKGRRLPDWKEEEGVAGELPLSPAVSHEKDEEITLIPYGAAKLRITAFPELARKAGGPA